MFPNYTRRLIHLALLLCMGAMWGLSRYAPDVYSSISQEDHIIEWLTVVIYFLAAFVGLYFALRNRRLFDGLVALFCLFNGGEECSWGQRLFGFNAPKYFLETNVQQELTLHNLFGYRTHDLFLSLTVLGYFVLLPIVARTTKSKRLLEKLGASAPPIYLAPWALVLIALYPGDPIVFSSEWIELSLAALFLFSFVEVCESRLTKTQLTISAAAVILAGVILTSLSSAQDRRAAPARSQCAMTEAQALLNDLTKGGAATEQLYHLDGAVHRRIFSAAASGYLRVELLQQFHSSRCDGPDAKDQEVRRQYAIDPWGMSYWLFVERRPDGSQQLTVYSFGPNRRRDRTEGAPGVKVASDDDEIAVTGELR